ncbi:MAG: PEP-CTERM sorting domain-containing protein, partial [Burkholderiaceae bacterium]|nr:PEP-CTERM sorting domain-containing protein [Burkholderiaceae bacterium]
AAHGAIAATLTFNLGGSGGLDNSAPSQFTFIQGGVTLRATPDYSTDNGSTLVENGTGQPYIAQWSPGLGVYDYCESRRCNDEDDDQHTVDNAPRPGMRSDRADDFIKFSFGGEQVRVMSIKLGCLGCDLGRTADWDISYRVGDGDWANRNNTGVGGAARDNNGNATYLFTSSPYLLASSDIFRVGAKFGDDNDSFKILAITVETQPPVVITTESVPVPGTVLLLGSALLGMGGLRRARRQA